MKMAKKKRGQPLKSCPECDAQCHARLATCKKCGFVFYKKKKKFIEDWKEELKPGDHVRVVGRSGTYYIKESGEKVYFTNPGVYLVKHIRDDGIVAIGTGRICHGYEFLYMGKEKQSSMLDSMYNSPHKLIGVSLKRKGES
tara:strand:+ start:10276 stop:10698 length:423 start_codon:yes stop_codon:yes gene_type:complete